MSFRDDVCSLKSKKFIGRLNRACNEKHLKQKVWWFKNINGIPRFKITFKSTLIMFDLHDDKINIETFHSMNQFGLHNRWLPLGIFLAIIAKIEPNIQTVYAEIKAMPGISRKSMSTERLAEYYKRVLGAEVRIDEDEKTHMEWSLDSIRKFHEPNGYQPSRLQSRLFKQVMNEYYFK